MAKKLKVIKFPLGSEPFVTEIGNDLDAFQAEVGGVIQIVEVDGLDLVSHEEALLIGLPFNRSVGGHLIHGDFFFCRHDDEGNSTSVAAARWAPSRGGRKRLMSAAVTTKR